MSVTELEIGLRTLVEIDGTTCVCRQAGLPHAPEVELNHRSHYARETLPSGERVMRELATLLAGDPDPALLARISLLIHRLDVSVDSRLELYRRTGYVKNGRLATRPTTFPVLYRGAFQAAARGAFWTPDRKTAEGHAAHHSASRRSDAYVFSTRPDPAAVLAHLTPFGLGEEYVVDPAQLGEVERVGSGGAVVGSALPDWLGIYGVAE